MSTVEPRAATGHHRQQRWTRVSRGLYRTDDCPELQAWQLVLPPCGRFTHLTAADALGWWVPPLPDLMPVVAAVDRGSNRPVRPGLRVVRSDPSDPPQAHGSLRLDAPTEVLLACARDLGMLDLLVLTDCVLHHEICSPAALSEIAACRRRGARALRRILPLTDRRSESPWETVLRLFHSVCEAPVEPQRELVMPDGRFVGRADLWLVGTRTVHEYDGADHLARPQQRADLKRLRRMVEAGYERRGYTSHDLLREPVTILRDIDGTLGRPHEPRRLRAWHALLADSLHTGQGKDRLLARRASAAEHAPSREFRRCPASCGGLLQIPEPWTCSCSPLGAAGCDSSPAGWHSWRAGRVGEPGWGRLRGSGRMWAMGSRQDYDGAPGRALTHAFVAMVAVALLVGASLGLALMAAAKIGGIGGSTDSAGGPEDDSPASLYMPSYEPTEDSGDGWNLPDPSESPPSLPGADGSDPANNDKPRRSGITLFVAPQQVSPGQRINFNGVYEGADGATLQVQRRDGGSWTDFPVTASVRGGSFETWIQTSRTGPSRFRMFDEAAGKKSNVVRVQIG